MEERLGALPRADLSDAGHIESSSVSILLGRLPAQRAQVRIQRIEPTVNPRVGTDLFQLAAALHECQAVCSTAHLRENQLWVNFKDLTLQMQI